MIQSGGERVRPVTADELIETNPFVDVIRHEAGMIEIKPTRGSPYAKLSTIVDMVTLPDDCFGMALRMTGKFYSGVIDTIVGVPIFGQLHQRSIQRGRRSPYVSTVIDMATDGVRLLDDAQRLPESEKRLLLGVPGGNQKIYDWFAFEEPTVTPDNIGEIPPLRGAMSISNKGVVRLGLVLDGVYKIMKD